MTNIEKQFVPYEQCLKLRDLGFDEDCIAGYRTDRNNCLTTPTNNSYRYIPTYGKYTHQNKHVLKATLWCQIFDWFEDKYDYRIHIYRSLTTYNKFSFDVNDNQASYLHSTSWRNSREEARIACLDKLIELIQENKLNK